MDKYLIVLEKTSTGFSVYSPDVLGCIATGDTIDEVFVQYEISFKTSYKSNLEDKDSIPIPKGIESYLEVARSDGEDYFITHIPMNELLAMQYS